MWWCREFSNENGLNPIGSDDTIKANSRIACRTHAVPR